MRVEGQGVVEKSIKELCAFIKEVLEILLRLQFLKPENKIIFIKTSIETKQKEQTFFSHFSSSSFSSK